MELTRKVFIRPQANLFMKKRKKFQLIKEHRHPLRWVEKFVDRIVPILLIILAVVVVLENPFWSLVDLHAYRSQLFVFDTLLVIFLAADLIFKWWQLPA